MTRLHVGFGVTLIDLLCLSLFVQQAYSVLVVLVLVLVLLLLMVVVVVLLLLLLLLLWVLDCAFSCSEIVLLPAFLLAPTRPRPITRILLCKQMCCHLVGLALFLSFRGLGLVLLQNILL